MDKKALVLIPSRYASTRFPGKPLAKISGKPMVQWVYEGCASITKDWNDTIVCVVTDNDEIEECVKGFGGKVVRVDDDVPSGSERIQLAYERFFADQDIDFVVNVQGDEPLIGGDLLKELLLFQDAEGYDVGTVVKRIPMTDPGYLDPNKVKAIYSSESGKCHFFTRSSFPHNREKSEGLDWFLHIGIYSFKPEVLKSFCGLNPSYYEQIECLEQLRLLDNGYSIGAVPTDMYLCGVDTPEDIEHIEGVLGGN
jgi:3-deoxy-manno-octulosonate cytidylyltransferase (CMP-KDO synthetase)